MAEPKHAEREDDDADQRPEDDVEMTFFEHLGELRTRLIRALLAMVPGLVIGWCFHEELMGLLLRPFLSATTQMDMAPELVFTDPTDAFFWYLVVAMIAALLFALPVIFWQLWGFISPGLYRREKRMAFPFVFASTALFAAGVYFCYAVVLEPTFMLFFSFAGEVGDSGVAFESLTAIDRYLALATRLLVAFGVTFEVPVVVTFLALVGLVNWKQLIKFGRWWLVISSIVAAVLTPPDMATMLFMMVPLNALYWLGVVLAAIVGPKPPPKSGVTTDGYER